MSQIFNLLGEVSWIYIILFCLTLGLAPYNPPHILEKINMLAKGTLKSPLDWFDLIFHSIPWIALLLKAILELKK